MQLKSVEMVGFKSFADRLVLDFGKGITGIVGPNGSGKSNVADAIRWVLGEQSAKSLRGVKMEDVIFAGTQRRRPVSFAQVVLTLDNSDRSLACDYDEVAVSRKMFRSGESEYMINGARCRLRDIQELFMDTGIGKDGYSMIGQGRIDQLLSNKPQDRRAIFEEASGIVKFKVRREEANAKLAQEQTSLQRVTDILEEASSRLEPLRESAERAEKYKTLYAEFRQLEIQNFLRQYDQLAGQSKTVLDRLADLTAQTEEAKANLAEIRKQSEQASADAEAAGAKLAETIQKMNDLRLFRESRSGEQKLFQSQAEQNEKDRKNAEIRLEDARKALKRHQETAVKVKEQLAGLEQQKEKQTQEQEELAARGNEIRQAAERAQEQLASFRQQLEELRNGINAKRQDLVRQETLHEQVKGEQGSRAVHLEELQAEVEARQTDAEQKNALLEEAKAAVQDYQQQILELTDTISALREKMTQAEQDAQNSRQKVQQLGNRIHWIEELEKEYEGYAGSVKTIMQLKMSDPDRYSGVHGTVADLMRLPQHLATAVEIALGGAVQNIVTDTQSTAQQMIEILRSKKMGRATFLPVDSVFARDVRKDPELEHMPGIIGYATDLVETDPLYEKIFSRLLGNVVIADTFENAAAAANRYGRYLRVVTLSGDLFNIGGSITGGSTGGRTASILNRRGEMHTLTVQLKAAEKENADKSAMALSLREERSRLAVRMQELSDSREEASGTQAARQSDYDQAELMLQMSKEQLQAEQEKNLAAERSIQEDQSVLAGMQDELQKMENQETVLSAAMQDWERQDEKARKELTDYNTQLMRNRIEISTSEQLIRSMQNSMEREDTDITEQQAQIVHYQEQIRFADAEMKRLEQENKASQTEIENAGIEIRKLSDEITALTADRDDKEQNEKRLRTEAERAAEDAADLEREQVRLDSQTERVRKELTDLQDQIWDKYEVTYNSAKEMDLPQPESQAWARRRISELRAGMKELEPVNLQAIDEYAALKDRCSFLTAQLEDVRKAEESLRELIGQLTEQMEQQFREGFGKISEQFNQVFQKMFGGGRGILRLEEGDPLESGIEIIAQPPGKTLKNMAALSGGERTLTAISILFAIQQLKPAPFCVLDEIEASLDDANVYRYADYLKEMADKTQFIIITHRKGTMEAASTMYGITMEEKGVSKCVSVRFE